jgi:putative spermidine/putrescine transport system permease protein
MNLSKRARIALGGFSALVLAILYIPLLVVLVNSFNPSRTFSWPPSGFSTQWWSRAISNEGVRTAFVTSLKAGFGATTVALILGTMAAFAVARYDFFGREAISLLVILPIALPGIVTGIALNSAFTTFLKPFGIGLGLFTVIVGHATFCIVVVYNNVLARLRRVGATLEEASGDLGANTFQTFRYVTFPSIRSSLVAGALLAFALSFDEIVVTTFTSGASIKTLPQWIFDNLFRPNQAPIINVVAACLILAFALPVWLSQRLSDGAAAGGRI